MAVPLEDLKAILHELVEVLVRCKVIDPPEPFVFGADALMRQAS